MADLPIDITRYGFTWGAADVVRCFDDKRFGACLEIRTKTQRLQVRITPGGQIRVAPVEKKRGRAKFPGVFRV